MHRSLFHWQSSKSFNTFARPLPGSAQSFRISSLTRYSPSELGAMTRRNRLSTALSDGLDTACCCSCGTVATVCSGVGAWLVALASFGCSGVGAWLVAKALSPSFGCSVVGAWLVALDSSAFCGCSGVGAWLVALDSSAFCGCSGVGAWLVALDSLAFCGCSVGAPLASSFDWWVEGAAGTGGTSSASFAFLACCSESVGVVLPRNRLAGCCVAGSSMASKSLFRAGLSCIGCCWSSVGFGTSWTPAGLSCFGCGCWTSLGVGA